MMRSDARCVVVPASQASSHQRTPGLQRARRDRGRGFIFLPHPGTWMPMPTPMPTPMQALVNILYLLRGGPSSDSRVARGARWAYAARDASARRTRATAPPRGAAGRYAYEYVELCTRRIAPRGPALSAPAAGMRHSSREAPIDSPSLKAMLLGARALSCVTTFTKRRLRRRLRTRT